MKTHVSPLTQTSCEKTFASSSSSWAPHWQPSLTRVRKSLSSALALARKAALAGLNALGKSSSNNRTYVGLVLILVAAPLAGVAYQVFDRSAHYGDWYHVNWYYFLFLLGPHIMMLLVITGIFLIMPQSRRAFFLAVPAGDQIARIMWLSMVTSNEDFYRIVPSYFLITGVSIAVLWLFTFDWLMSLHFHKREGTRARQSGIINLNELGKLSDAEAMKILRNEERNLKIINQQ